MAAMKKKPHVLLVPYPAQGHVVPMLKLAQKLADDHGFTVTVVNLEFIHQKLVSDATISEHQSISLTAIPNGFELSSVSGQAESVTKIMENVENVLPIHLRTLLDVKKNKRNKSAAGDITWLIGDAFLSAGAFQVAKEMGIKTAAFWTGSAATLALLLRIPQLIQDGILDENGTLINRGMPICLSKDIPAWQPDEFPWSCQPEQFQRFGFKAFSSKPSENSTLFDCFIVNSLYQLEPAAFQLFPKLLPIGPLVTNSTSGGNQHNQIPGSFWHQDQTCSTWLDKHPPKSVVYVAFGSTTALNQKQFQELATGLEMTKRPFLWVIRSDFVNGTGSSGQEFVDGFLERVANRGKIVEWANQEEVLSHRSTACFVSHCGWNSTSDGLWNGVPFLCWPYFSDQFHNREAICEAWKVGLKLKAEDEDGLVTRFEICSRVEELICDATIRENASKLRENARECVSDGGTSFRNFLSFVEILCS
uniref:UDP-glycosyltransferase 1 n=1 Tax=Linum usitatissimum TaxID=4006 RepID=I2BH89_LINUS|nr:UDP-glycosyltransferase 1 [Linum usitatissimum]